MESPKEKITLMFGKGKPSSELSQENVNEAEGVDIEALVEQCKPEIIALIKKAVSMGTKEAEDAESPEKEKEDLRKKMLEKMQG